MFDCSQSRDTQLARQASGIKLKGGFRNLGSVLQPYPCQLNRCGYPSHDGGHGCISQLVPHELTCLTSAAETRLDVQIDSMNGCEAGLVSVNRLHRGFSGGQNLISGIKCPGRSEGFVARHLLYTVPQMQMHHSGRRQDRRHTA